MVKLVEFSSPIDNSLPFDVVDDVSVYMRNDPMFYRKHYYPAIAKLADNHRAGKVIDKHSALSAMIERGLNGYCKKFKVANLPDEIFNNDDREQLIDKIFSEEMEEIQKGEYK